MTTQKKRELGKSGLAVAPLALGGNVFGWTAEDSLKRLKLIREGKVRAIGASNYSAQRLSKALQVSEQRGLPAYQSLQPLYNLYERSEYEPELEPLCRENGLGVIPYFPLASGFLTGKYLDARGFRILDALDRASA